MSILKTLADKNITLTQLKVIQLFLLLSKKILQESKIGSSLSKLAKEESDDSDEKVLKETVSKSPTLHFVKQEIGYSTLPKGQKE